MALPPNIPQCQYVRVDGTRCGSPALRSQRFCYYHHQLSRPRPLAHLPPLDEPRAIQLALMELARALVNNQVDLKKAGLLAYILQIAVCNLKGASRQPLWEYVVREVPREAPPEEALPPASAGLPKEHARERRTGSRPPRPDFLTPAAARSPGPRLCAFPLDSCRMLDSPYPAGGAGGVSAARKT